jgi:hypothetical protein
VPLHDRVLATYNFSPHTSSKAEIATKSKELDAFWSEIKAQEPAPLRELREELARPDSPPFFSYDGAKLLLSLSKSRADDALALAAISRADLRDVQYIDYFLTVHAMSVDGLDTTAAAFKILSDDRFQIYIAQHALKLDQETCLLYLLLPTDETFYLSPAANLLLTEQSLAAQKSLLTLLANTVTKQGDAAIARFEADSTRSPQARAYARTIMDATQKMSTLPLLGISSKSYASLKTEQRQLFGRVSDEALGEWEHLRIKIRHKGPE